ncbi:alpha/beta fold hydrolase [Nocardia aurantiaca]|uniref:Alpha/beta fold hydrolase n=1 Tax=Nocardia aurantiaca TaxID=2675850 RepID=A0A6I3L9Q1_9NOCA|nr:alpha/beta fold hydrolase [Nocardia aurantiaca]MTE17514.1 alpha/beta fold hydrolase [Nocardia aurantiaca]
MTKISPESPVLTTQVSGSGPAIVLAHGGGGGIDANFGGLIPLLAADHLVIGSDFPADDTPLTLDSLADALVVEAIAHGAETFSIVAFSLGTAVAIRAAVRHPERVRGLVLTGGFARPDNRARLNIELWQRALAAGDRESFARYVLLAGFSADFVNAIPEEELSDVLARTAANIPGGTAAQAALIETADVRADLPRVAVPTLVIGLAGDLLCDPANAREQAAGIPGAEYLELPGGHVVMVERPEAWHAAVLDFFTGQQASSAAPSAAATR